MYVLPPVVDGSVVFAKKNEEKMEKYAIIHGNIIIIGLQYI